MISRTLRISLLMLVLIGLGACPASPPAGIPAPVPELLSAGNPDSSGNIKLSGAPGAVNGGALVTANDVPPSSGRWFQKLFLPLAWAGTGSQNGVFADPDGSFQLEIAAQVGDTIEVFQTVDDETSPPTSIKINGNVINLEGKPRDIKVDPLDGSLWISAADAGGRIYRINFGEGLPSSFSDPFCGDGLDGGITRLALVEAIGTGFVISPAQQAYYSFLLDGDCVPVPMPLPAPPVDIVPSPVANNVLIALEGSARGSILSADDKGLNANCSVTIVEPENPTPHSATLLLATISSGLPRVFSVNRFEDGSHWATRFNANVCPDTKPADVLLPEGVEPSGLAVIDADRVLVSDAAHGRVLLVDFSQGAVTGEFAVGQDPMGLGVSPNLNKAFVVNQGSNSLSGIDLDDFSLTTQTGVGLMPFRIGILPGGIQAGVLSSFDDAVHLTNLDF